MASGISFGFVFFDAVNYGESAYPFADSMGVFLIGYQDADKGLDRAKTDALAYGCHVGDFADAAKYYHLIALTPYIYIYNLLSYLILRGKSRFNNRLQPSVFNGLQSYPQFLNITI